MNEQQAYKAAKAAGHNERSARMHCNYPWLVAWCDRIVTCTNPAMGVTERDREGARERKTVLLAKMAKGEFFAPLIAK